MGREGSAATTKLDSKIKHCNILSGLKASCFPPCTDFAADKIDCDDHSCINLHGFVLSKKEGLVWAGNGDGVRGIELGQ